VDLYCLGHAALVVDTGRTRILFDPWLTGRLDRFWVRNPGLDDAWRADVTRDLDAIVMSHHHYDHHHYPSLGLLDRGTPVVYPASQTLPRFTGSGLGHQAIPWTLRRLGFERIHPMSVPDRCTIGDVTIRSLPSRVIFPEATYLLETPDGTVLLCGDSLLHEGTRAFLASPEAPPVDVAFVPAHSLAPPGPLLRREPVADGKPFEDQARANFEAWVDAIDAQVTVPGSFGWRIEALGAHDFAWLNRLLFPFTPWQAYEWLRSRGRQALLPGPGDRLRVEHGVTEVEGPCVGDPERMRRVWEPLTLDARTAVPALDPDVDRFDGPEASPLALGRRLLDELVGTDYWFHALEAGSRPVVRVHGSAVTEDVVLDFSGGGQVSTTGAAGSGRGGDTVLSIAAATLRALLDADLLFESSYGLWTGTDNLLSAVLHQPDFYVRHVERQLAA
jgi:L-ascorbate metabolism protein UlaG (beta-lactamase superfamily)